MVYGYTRSYMDLKQAVKISVRPSSYKPARWERALRILTRWAEDPCSDEEYQYRLEIAVRVFVPYRKWVESIEASKRRQEELIARISTKEFWESIQKGGKKWRKVKSLKKGRPRRLGLRATQAATYY